MDTVRTDQILAPEVPPEAAPLLLRKRKGQLRIIFERFVRNRVALVGMVILAFIFLACIFAPLITHYDPDKTDVLNFLSHPTGLHWLGTDYVGRDELARLLYGGRVSLLVGLASMFVTITVGVTVGAIAGFYGGWLDAVMMRITDAFLAVPLYLILFVLSATFITTLSGTANVIGIVLIIAFFSWPITARIVRGEFLSLKQREFLLAARTLGAGNIRLMLRHILPNAAGPIIVNATLLIGSNIITESTLSFFNFGLQPPTSSWGTMIASSKDYFLDNPVLVFAPGIAILLTVLCFNLMGDGLRDALDPYMTER
jgi:peptide/nickel transport system permease protein